MFEKKQKDVEINIKQNKKQEIKYILDNLLKPHEGHNVFEIDYVNKEIRDVELIPLHSVNFLSWKQQIKEQEILKKEGCLYVYALNIVNLRRKLEKYNKEYAGYNYIASNSLKILNKHRKVKIVKETFAQENN